MTYHPFNLHVAVDFQDLISDLNRVAPGSCGYHTDEIFVSEADRQLYRLVFIDPPPKWLEAVGEVIQEANLGCLA